MVYLKKKRTYNPWKLVHYQRVEGFSQGDQSVQCICDIDKTYLETDFDTLFQLAKIVLWEGPRDKITVKGALDALQAFRWGDRSEASRLGKTYPRPLHFLSSSPSYLKTVLGKKFQMDGLDWTSHTFKNQSYYIKKGRFDLFRYQITYKSAAIIHLLKKSPDQSYLLIGDSAESDPYIYLGFYLYLSKKLSLKGYEHYLSLLGVEPKIFGFFLDGLKQIEKARIKGIFIRNLPDRPLKLCPPLTDPIFAFTDYFDVILRMTSLGLLTPDHAQNLGIQFQKVHGLNPEEMESKWGWFADQKLLPPRKTGVGEIPNPNWRWQEPGELDSLKEEEILDLAKTWFQTGPKNQKA